MFAHFPWASLTGTTPRVQNRREKMDTRQLCERLTPWALSDGSGQLCSLPRRAGFRVWIPQVGQRYPNQLQQQSLNQECHVRSKGSSSHRHVWLRIFRAPLLPGRHWSWERDPCAHRNICKAAAERPALHPGAACQGPLGPLSVLMEQ